MERLPFDRSVNECLTKARDLALSSGSITCEPVHLLRVLADEREGAAAMLLRREGIDPLRLRESIEGSNAGRPRGKAQSWRPREELGRMAISAATQAVLDDAIGSAIEDLSREVTLSHLVAAISRSADPVVHRLFRGESATSGTRNSAGIGAALGSRLMTYGRLLTADAADGRLDPVIGRDDELRRLTYILGRRRKNNPVLIGAPGVGKTAIVEGLAQLIAANQVPGALRNKEIFALNIGSLVAGTKYRGEFEERVQHLLDVVASRGDSMITFIDEIHTIAGAGGAEGAIDAASFFKPLLARGELRVIGATTPEEYRRRILKDGALERRFQPVVVVEPNADVALQMLRGLRSTYVGYHAVDISDDALRAAVTLSEKYILGRHLPDKAIDLIDEAASRKRARLDDPQFTASQAHAGENAPVVEAADVEEVARDWAGTDLGVAWQEEVYAAH